MRLFCAGLVHESSSDAVPLTGPTGLDQFHLSRGDETRTQATGTRTVAAGVLDGAAQIGWDVEFGVYAGAYPSATIAGDVYVQLRDEILDSLREAGAVDAVFLLLHGAAGAEGVDDVEGDLAGRVREIVGADLPVVTVLDLHGLVTPAMARAIDVMLGCHEYPHVDLYERAIEAVRLLPRLVDAGRPVTHLEWLPISVPMTATALEPLAGINARCAEHEQRPGVIDCTFFHGYPYTNSPLLGATVVVITDDDAELAAEIAKDVASFVWSLRDQLRPPFLDPAVAVERAVAAATAGGPPVVIVDSADNQGAGAPGDNTRLLRALLDAGAEGCLGYFCDPDAAAAAHGAGVGAKIDVTLGGRHPDLQGSGVPVTAEVAALAAGTFTLTTAMVRGVVEDLGPMALLRVGPLDIIVCSRARQVLDPGGFEALGIDVRRQPIVALKSRQHWRAGFADIPREVFIADGGGLSTYRVELMPRDRRPHPLWPFDDAQDVEREHYA